MPIRNLTIAAAIVIAALPSQAAAEPWRMINISDERAQEIDLGSISRTGDLVRYWRRDAFYEGDEYDHIIGLSEANCSSGQTRVLQVTAYFRDGTTDTDTRPSDWQYAIPGTVGERALELVCAHQAD